MTNNLRSWFRESFTFKFIVVAFLVLLLLIPAAMIRSLIIERESTRNMVIAEVSDKWAGYQVLSGPLLTIPFLESQEVDGVRRTVRRHAHFLPADLQIEGKVEPEVRYRSIYEVVVYAAELQIAGRFDPPDLTPWNVPDDKVLWDEASVSFGISDMRGINKPIAVDLNDVALDSRPGTTARNLIPSGISVHTDSTIRKGTAFSFALDLNGSGELSFIPVGRTTRVRLSSPWRDPSFMGAFLPDEREVDDSGFTAEWTVLELNRNYPQSFTDNEYDIMGSRFGVELIFGVDLYQKAERSAKYAIMFLALTFLVFLLSEILNRKRIHPIQYLLIGVALSIFYTLLIAFAEHIGFNLAYLIASMAVVIMITLYTWSILRSRRITFFTGLALVLLYLFLYTILQLEAYALLMGSIGLFVVIGITMFLTRKIDWYGNSPDRGPEDGS